MSPQQYDRELVDIGLQLIISEMPLQKENQRYGWIMKRKKVRWHSLRVDLMKNSSSRLKEKLRTTDSEMEVSYCRPEQGPLLGEDDETVIVDDFLNSMISSKLPKDDMVETTDEDSYVFKSNCLCMDAGIEEHLDDVFMQVGEEMKQLEEMAEIEQFLIEYVFKDNEYGKSL